ncbi:MAG: PIN domain-containing protein [Thermodesulfobacteriota bacterium]
MVRGKTFIDTNVLLCLFSGETAKADRAEEVVEEGGWLSVQVLNEFVAVASRKLGMTWSEIGEATGTIRAVCQVASLSDETHDLGLRIAERYGFAFYDALIVAAALQSGCEILYTEDLQDGQRIEGSLVISNPFKIEE